MQKTAERFYLPAALCISPARDEMEVRGMQKSPSQAESDSRGRQPVRQQQSLEVSPETPLWADPMETATGRWPMAEDSEETTSLFENGESFGREGPLEERPEDMHDDELTDHVQQYMRQLAKTHYSPEKESKRSPCALRRREESWRISAFPFLSRHRSC